MREFKRFDPKNLKPEAPAPKPEGEMEKPQADEVLGKLDYLIGQKKINYRQQGGE